VSVSRQRLCCIGSDSGFAAGTSDDRLIRELPCSTSKFCIREKIGAESPTNTVFKGRKPIGTTAEIPDARITTRILWLAGLEPGFNQGGKVDTHDRYVYIHGTGDESTIGSPDSHGCVHLRAEDLIPLFDEVESGTLVWIEE
jgi:hypothetical protein